MIWLGVATISQRDPSLLIMLPFAILVISIAIAPIILQHRWERYYHKVCLGLAAFVGGYYLLARHDAERVLHAGFEYVSFIAVVGSFFVVSGGTHLRAPSHVAPAANTIFHLLREQCRRHAPASGPAALSRLSQAHPVFLAAGSMLAALVHRNRCTVVDLLHCRSSPIFEGDKRASCIWRHREVALLRQTQFDLHVDHARCADRISTDLARGRYRGMRNHVLLLDASAHPRG